MADTIVVIGDQAAFLKLSLLPGAIEREVALAVQDSRLWLQAALIEQVKKRTGNLARALGVDVQHLPDHIIRLRATVSQSAASYARPLDRGTGVYGPFHAPYLARWRRGARTGVYLHPGMRAQPYVQPAIFDARPRIEERWRAIGHRVKLETRL